MPDDLAQQALQEWTPEAVEIFNQLEKLHPGILAGGITTVIGPPETPAVRAQFLQNLSAAQSIEEFSQILDLRVQQVGAEQAMKEFRQSGNVPK